jgi:hypothetical protein
MKPTPPMMQALNKVVWYHFRCTSSSNEEAGDFLKESAFNMVQPFF